MKSLLRPCLPLGICLLSTFPASARPGPAWGSSANTPRSRPGLTPFRSSRCSTPRSRTPASPSGPDQAFYLTGSALAGQGAGFTNRLSFWRSADRKQWTLLRTLDLKDTQARSPELHFLDGRFWLTLGLEGGGTELLRFDTTDLATSGFQRARMTEHGEDPSLFRDDDQGTFYWVTGAGEIAPMKANPP